MSDFETYQRAAARTINTKLSREDLLLMCAIKLQAEAGEAGQMISDALIHGKPLDLDKLILELGDVMWYLACYCSALNVPMAGVAEENIGKLRERWPGKFGEGPGKLAEDAPVAAPVETTGKQVQCSECSALATFVRAADGVEFYRCVQAHITRVEDCACDGVGMCAEHVEQMLDAHPMEPQPSAGQDTADALAVLLAETAPCERCGEESSWQEEGEQRVFKCAHGHVTRMRRK